jgi:hypothetical protein
MVYHNTESRFLGFREIALIVILAVTLFLVVVGLGKKHNPCSNISHFCRLLCSCHTQHSVLFIFARIGELQIDLELLKLNLNYSIYMFVSKYINDTVNVALAVSALMGWRAILFL